MSSANIWLYHSSLLCPFNNQSHFVVAWVFFAAFRKELRYVPGLQLHNLRKGLKSVGSTFTRYCQTLHYLPLSHYPDSPKMDALVLWAWGCVYTLQKVVTFYPSSCIYSGPAGRSSLPQLPLEFWWMECPWVRVYDYGFCKWNIQPGTIVVGSETDSWKSIVIKRLYLKCADVSSDSSLLVLKDMILGSLPGEKCL